MAVDSLTKKMKPDVLVKLMTTGKLDLNATAGSEILKMKKRKRRKEKQAAEAAKDAAAK